LSLSATIDLLFSRSAEIHLRQTGHFALETHLEEIVTSMRNVLHRHGS
jgi:hypothetical protein